MAVSVVHSYVSSVAESTASGVPGGTVGPTEWNAGHVVSGIRVPVTANTSYHVSSTGSDTGDGSSGSPWLTLQHAMNVISGTVDFGGFDVTVNVSSGTFAGCDIKSCVGGGNLIFLGNGPGSSIISNHAPSFTGVISNPIRMDTSVSFDGFTFKPNGNFSVFNCLTGGSLFWGGAESFTSNNALDLTLATGGGGKVFAANDIGSTIIIQGNVNFPTPTTVTASTSVVMQAFYQSFAGALIENFENWSFTGSPTFTNAFSIGQSFGLIIEGGESYTGAVTCPRVNLATGSGVLGFSLGALGVNYFPGTSFGTVDFSSVYDGYNFAQSISSAPTTSNLPEAGTWGIFDGGVGQVYVAYNQAGTIRKVQLT